ncbi:Acetoin dehydrogenase E1 component alpha-subunit [hydrothermal vent metagenome]|uniref:Acetoin dehydrogenase E1 component alpha-subunit n=1 Tax=hydrothermal vent metagenome TaxID=652676 RepID=A0A3B0S4D0_9ZZZZ
MSENHTQLLWAYRTMQTIRMFEDRMHDVFTTGEVPGFVHLYSGQEACAVGVCANLTAVDYFHITHRAHGPALARGADVTAVAKEIYCRRDGLCRGRGGSAHLHDAAKKIIGANSGVGSGAALACGSALATRHRGDGGIAVALIGEGGANQGVVSEALNLASIWKLPVLFVFENNGYAEATSADYAIAGGNLSARATGFAMPETIVDGSDYFAVTTAISEAAERARAGEGPSLIEVRNLRYYGHYEGDAQKYRPPGEVEEYRKNRDCLKNFRKTVLAKGWLAEADFVAIDQEVTALIDTAYEAARMAPLPDPEELMQSIYATVY